ncbi:MAG TPA: hypothetical protein VGV07_18015 [Devosia sp.]|jgi:hypothetical protein|uniref:hypothetical protein n=1 Tax=Devosia sp. TaxID=1871048 RepID=UPI002DDCE817|nr:hypothetical protein [Devosia sp.]HEV2517155.1 hypothetical protein [Devosia sp.]
MLTVPAAIAALEPATAVLPADLTVCSLADDLDVAAEAMLLRHAPPTTGFDKYRAKVWRLFLTLHRRGHAIPRAFVIDTLIAAVGLDTTLRRAKVMLRVAHAAGTQRRTGEGLLKAALTSVPKAAPTPDKPRAFLSERQGHNYLADPEVAALARAVEADEDALHHIAHPVSDPERLAGQIVAHVRAWGYVSDDDRFACFLLTDSVMLSRAPVAEATVVALALVLGVLDPAIGQPARSALEVLLCTRQTNMFISYAREDATTKRMTGRWPERFDGQGRRTDRSADRWRKLAPYIRLGG